MPRRRAERAPRARGAGGNDAILGRVERLAQIGSWSRDLATNEVVSSAESRRIFGFPRESAPGYEDFLGRLHPDDRPRVQELNEQAERHGHGFTVEVRLVRGDLLRTIEVRADVLSEGGRRQLVGVIRDVTERKLLEEGLARSQAQLALLLEAVPALVYTVRLHDLAMLSMTPNTPALTGYDIREFQARPVLWRERVHPEEVGAVLRHQEAAARGGRSELEFRWRLRDGTYRWFRERARGMALPGGAPGIMAVCKDVTPYRTAGEERRLLVEQMLAAQASERERLARELHDDTGQALAALLVGLRNLQSSGSAADVRRTTARLRGLVSGVMESLDRLTRGLQPPIADGPGLAAALRRHLQAQARTHRFKLRLDVPEEALPLGREALQHLYRIAQEAVANVAHHADARHVRVTLEREEGTVRLEVQDDGRGFAVAGALSGTSGRLGLRGIRERAAHLGGVATICSEPGRGTVVTVQVPVKRAARPRAGRRA